MSLTRTANTLLLRREHHHDDTRGTRYTSEDAQTYTIDALGVVRERITERRTLSNGQLERQTRSRSVFTGDACPRARLPEASTDPLSFHILP